MIKPKILIAMSGGVDSSVAALLIKEQKLECTGITMKLFSLPNIELNLQKSCCNPDEANDALRVAEKLGIPFEICDFSADFKHHVIDYFIQTYLEGGTPNPCVACNRTMKFAKLYEAGEARGCTHIATGHYARISCSPDGRWLLRTATDREKDQSYVLWSLTQEQLAHTMLPLGELTKQEVREIAAAHGFENADRPDSQDICFIPDGDYVSFIERSTGKSFPTGNFVDLSGRVLGQHQGYIRYTVGQRKGLGIAFGKPTYVCGINATNNTVTLGDNEDLFRNQLTAHGINLIATDRVNAPIRVQAKIRYKASPAPATLEQIDTDRIRLCFDTPQRAITPGQSVVFYDGDTVIGGGIID